MTSNEICWTSFPPYIANQDNRRCGKIMHNYAWTCCTVATSIVRSRCAIPERRCVLHAHSLFTHFHSKAFSNYSCHIDRQADIISDSKFNVHPLKCYKRQRAISSAALERHTSLQAVKFAANSEKHPPELRTRFNFPSLHSPSCSLQGLNQWLLSCDEKFHYQWAAAGISHSGCVCETLSPYDY